MTHDERPGRGAQAIDRLLSEAGARWRASQPEPTFMEVEDLVAINTPRPRRTVLAAAATAVAVLFGLGIAHHEWADRRPTESPAANATPTPVVRNGDRVAGFGFIWTPKEADTRLCMNLIGGINTGPGCEGVAVPLDRLPATNLPGWRVEFGTASSSEVRVEGIYLAGRLQVEKVTPARPDEVDSGKLPPPPCDPPPGGWESTNPSRSDNPDLDAFLQARADVYSGAWTGLTDTISPSLVVVVGTTGDVAAARRELARYVPVNLCVHHVRFSQATLDRLRMDLSARLPDAPDAEVLVDTPTDTVRVSVVAYDKRTHEAVRTADSAAVRVSALLRPVD